jgi:hypothetical protein
MRHDLFRISTPALALLLCAGCIDGEEEDALPAPAVWRAELPELGADAQRRQREVDRYIMDELYRGYSIVETTQTYSGDLIDWVDPDTVPGSRIQPPPPPTAADLETPPGVLLQPTELDQHPELRGPDGTIPFTRPRFASYVHGDSGHDSLDAYLKADEAPQIWPGVFRLYSGYRKTVPNTKVAGFFNQSIGQIQPGTFSVLEMTTFCGGASAELVGMAVSKDMVNFNDAIQRLRVEFLTAGKNAMGNNKGGWDGKVTGFVAAAGRPYGPNIALAQSIIGGTQYESSFHIENFAGDWWVAHNGNWLGYYPAWLFNLINFQGCEAQWYGEVYDPTPSDWTWTDMGSGYFASAGYAWASHVRNPYYVTSSVPTWLDAPSDMEPTINACYTDSGLLYGALPWERYFHLGGPGGNGAGCD